MTITGISGTTITFTPGLEFEHYGDTGVTIQNNVGTLDARSAVGHLNRKIKIKRGDDSNNWGCRVLIFGYFTGVDENYYFQNGYAKLVGVEMDGCSQYDTTKAALNIEKVGSLKLYPNEEETHVSKSSLHNCGGFCVYIK